MEKGKPELRTCRCGREHFGIYEEHGRANLDCACGLKTSASSFEALYEQWNDNKLVVRY